MIARSAVGLALLLAAAGCEANREFACQVGAAGVCVRDGVTGQCVAPGYCAFRDPRCGGSELRYDSTASSGLAGTCVAGVGGDGGVPNTCGGSEPLEGTPGEPCGACGTYACAGLEAVVCAGEESLDVAVTGEGVVEASTVFDDRVAEFGPQLAVDGQLDSSWFSDGPGSETDNAAKFTWTGEQVDCIGRVTAIGNGQHENQNFREGFGFAQVTVEVYEGADLRFSQSLNLPGTPDPDAVVTPNVRGDIVRLVFTGHEDPSCGGFAELIINAVR